MSVTSRVGHAAGSQWTCLLHRSQHKENCVGMVSYFHTFLKGGGVLSPWNILSGRVGYFSILTLVTHTPPTHTTQNSTVRTRGTNLKIDFRPYLPLKCRNKSCSTVVVAVIINQINIFCNFQVDPRTNIENTADNGLGALPVS